MTQPPPKAPRYYQHHPTPAITLFHGVEPLLIQEAIDALRARAKADHFSERQRLEMERDSQWSQLLTEVDTPSLFAPKRLLELHSDEKSFKKTATAVLKALASRSLQQTRILIHAPALERPQNAAWFKALSKSDFLEVRSYSLSPRDMEEQIQHRLKQAGLRLDHEALTLFMNFVEGNLLAANQAIERLVYRPDHEEILTADALKTTLDDFSRFSSHDFAHALRRADWQSAYRIAEKIEAEAADQIILLCWLIARDAHLLFQLKSQGNTEYAALFSQYRIYARQQKEYLAVLKYHSPGSLLGLLRLTGKLDRIAKGAEPGDAWLTLRQYLVLRIR